MRETRKRRNFSRHFFLEGLAIIFAVFIHDAAFAEPAANPGGERMEKATSTQTFTISSSAFVNLGTIPVQFTGDGKDLSPPLTWSNVPSGTKELALIVDDPDAPTPKPWVHWVIYKIPADQKGLVEGFPPNPTLPEVGGALQGKNTWENSIGYRGPLPPQGHGTHHYHFKLYALGRAIDAKPNLDKEGLLAAIADHTLATAELIGVYQR